MMRFPKVLLAAAIALIALLPWAAAQDDAFATALRQRIADRYASDAPVERVDIVYTEANTEFGFEIYWFRMTFDFERELWVTHSLTLPWDIGFDTRYVTTPEITYGVFGGDYVEAYDSPIDAAFGRDQIADYRRFYRLGHVIDEAEYLGERSWGEQDWDGRLAGHAFRFPLPEGAWGSTLVFDDDGAWLGYVSPPAPWVPDSPALVVMHEVEMVAGAVVPVREEGYLVGDPVPLFSVERVALRVDAPLDLEIELLLRRVEAR